MKTSETSERADAWRKLANEARQAGDVAAEIDSLRHAAALYASLHIPGEETDAEGTSIEPANDRAHAEVCTRLGERLWQQERLPEAIQAYQEATDAYGRIPAAERNAAECAQKVREGISVLRNNPKDRLYLLIATHERRQRQYAEQPGTEKQQADCAYQIASIFKRRERYTEAVERFEEALGLFRRAEDTALQQADCLRALGDLFSTPSEIAGTLNDPIRAFTCYKQATALYREHEPTIEGRQVNRLLCEQGLKALSTDYRTFIENLL